MKIFRLLCILYCLLFSQAICAENSTVEYKIKAGYLYNFTKFVTWPEVNSETFNVCIWGEDHFGELMDPIEQRTAFGRPIKLFRFDSFSSKDKELHCHILYISSSVKDMPSVQDFDNTLVVGESEEFIEQGGMIGFVNKQGKIKLQINLKTIKQGGLKVSAKLLEVAEMVKGDN